MRVISIVPFLLHVRRVTDSWIHLMRKYAINVVTVRKLLVIRVTVCEADSDREDYPHSLSLKCQTTEDRIID